MSFLFIGMLWSKWSKICSYWVQWSTRASVNVSFGEYDVDMCLGEYVVDVCACMCASMCDFMWMWLWFSYVHMFLCGCVWTKPNSFCPTMLFILIHASWRCVFMCAGNTDGKRSPLWGVSKKRSPEPIIWLKKRSSETGSPTGKRSPEPILFGKRSAEPSVWFSKRSAEPLVWFGKRSAEPLVWFGKRGG